MGTIKRRIRNARFGTKIMTVLSENECLMYQAVMSCSTNRGKLWCGAVVGLSDKRFFVEWQRTKGKNIAIAYEQIISWQVGNELGGISGIVAKIVPNSSECVDVYVNPQMMVRIYGEASENKILINNLKKYCHDKQK
ncbi:MAG: hypothetical protein IJO65_07010 [Lachnospiraceae bacterium]|nr:hypothetical protein [Lachnospiraceae bacterium]